MDEVDLRLMSSMKNVSEIPAKGKNLVIVAAVNGLLHFRIYDEDGNEDVIDEKRLTEQARSIEDFRKQLESLWPPHELTKSEKGWGHDGGCFDCRSHSAGRGNKSSGAAVSRFSLDQSDLRLYLTELLIQRGDTGKLALQIEEMKKNRPFYHRC